MFSQQIVLITGVSRGIGKGLAHSFLQEGAQVYGICRSTDPIDGLENDRFTQLSGSVTDQAFITSAITEIIARHQKIDVLINNAGVAQDALFQTMSFAQFDHVLSTNFLGTLHLTQAVLPHMQKAQKGKIINMVSQSGVSGREGQANYACSKGAIIGLTRTVARQYGKDGIYCNALSPTFISTDMIDHIPQSIIEPVLSHTALGRVGSVQEISDATLYLASTASNYQTGAVVRLDGGLAV
ncbi:SDR family NAD(P)-dependent oxidoreductase [Pseudoalteromonas aurantia]|uniref:3-oxoacyl-ACP reductase n=1 Tax=Pseudoalteromonas aurantia 208 TaxID=1314867 RepID=A0ABR9EHN3_9GAMM|nr:SDR family oxidoreductase [Pseudoalteromonas aurantia]MBE0370471.1 hypothetical protein [Pseudoalteromonas aurantia 208]